MSLLNFRKKKEAEDTRIALVVRASADAIATVQSAGRYPLSLLVVGAAVVIVSLIIWKFVAAVENLLPWLLTFAAFLAILGVVVYALDCRLRQNLLQQSLDHYHELVREAFVRYLGSLNEIGDFQFQGILNELDKIYRTSIDKVVAAQQQEQPNN